jgi:hypothetical protein
MNNKYTNRMRLKLPEQQSQQQGVFKFNGLTFDRDNNVTFNMKRLTMIDTGIEDTDATNLNQLRVERARIALIESRLTTIDKAIADIEKKLV